MDPLTTEESKLTEDQVLEIRQRYSRRMAGGAEGLAKEYGVSGTMIRYIVHRQKWAHLQYATAGKTEKVQS